MKKFYFEETLNKKSDERDKFISRIFGIFSEDIVRCWCKNDKAKYKNVGRLTIYTIEEIQKKKRGKTLDFTFDDKSGKFFVGELKCELEYQNYKFIELNDPEQLKHHDSEAFKRFLGIGENPGEYIVRFIDENGNKKDITDEVKGSILVWGRINDKTKQNMQSYKFADILSIEDMINNLLLWDDKEYLKLIETKNEWTVDLMSALVGGTDI